MKCSLHPVFYVLLGFSLPRCILLLLPSIRVKWLWISVSNWPSKATGQFVRHISSPFPPFLYFLSSFLSFFLFSLALRLLFLPVFRATTVAVVVDKRKTAETEGHNPLPLAQRCFDERLNDIENSWLHFPFSISFFSSRELDWISIKGENVPWTEQR